MDGVYVVLEHRLGSNMENLGGLCHKLIPKITATSANVSILLGNYSRSFTIYRLRTKLYFFTGQGNGTDHGKARNWHQSSKGDAGWLSWVSGCAVLNAACNHRSEGRSRECEGNEV